MKILNRWTGAIIYEDAGANLRGANLSDANLSDANLRGADLRGADLRGADLRGADPRGADLRDSDLRGADLRGADLRGADLRGADPRGADLRDSDLRGADLRGADLRDANLSGANLRGANLSDANLPEITALNNLRSAIFERVCEAPQALEMSKWHTCETTHCLAGWAVVIHPQGKLLESVYGTSAAAAMIFQVCEGEVPSFHSSNKAAMEWLKKEKNEQ